MQPGRKAILAVLAALPLCAFVLFLLYGPNSDGVGPFAHPHVLRNSPAGQKAEPDYESSQFWKTVDFQKQDVPKEIASQAKEVKVEEKKIKVQDATVYYREAKPHGEPNPYIDVLLMHGAAFSSKTWLDLGTLRLLAAMGYRTVAIDVPGFGNSPSASIKDRADFVSDLIKALQLRKPVIVSPSMSGTYALPYLEKYWDMMGGYVPVAPVGIDVLTKATECGQNEDKDAVNQVNEALRGFLKPPVPNLSCIKVPTLVVYGEQDRGRNSAILSLLPWSQAAEIPKGRHPAYLDNPELWHKLLYNFLGHAATLAAHK